MTSAGEEAKRLGNSKIYPEHLFLGLLKLRSGRAIDILMSLGLDFYEVKDKIEQRLGVNVINPIKWKVLTLH